MTFGAVAGVRHRVEHRVLGGAGNLGLEGFFAFVFGLQGYLRILMMFDLFPFAHQDEDDLPLRIIFALLTEELPFFAFVGFKAPRQLSDVALITLNYLTVVEVSPGRHAIVVAFECLRHALGQIKRLGQHGGIGLAFGAVAGVGHRVEDRALFADGRTFRQGLFFGHFC